MKRDYDTENGLLYGGLFWLAVFLFFCWLGGSL